MTMLRTIGRLAFVATMLSNTGALASPEFPEALQSETGAPCPPPCTVCHRDSNGGLGTVTKPFGKSMIGAQLEAANTQALKSAVATLRSQQTDSDGDGTPDIDELEKGSDPNAGGDVTVCGPTYGCGARVEPRGEIDRVALSAVLLSLGAMAALGRRRRRRGAARERRPAP